LKKEGKKGELNIKEIGVSVYVAIKDERKTEPAISKERENLSAGEKKGRGKGGLIVERRMVREGEGFRFRKKARVREKCPVEKKNNGD